MDKTREAIYRALNWTPWPTQLEGHNSECRFKALFGGARYGKSRWGAMEAIPDILKPNTRGWIVGPTYEQPSKEFRYIYDSIVVRMRLRPKKELNSQYSSPGTQMLLFPWGAEVYTKSEQNPESLLGEELDWMILSEGSQMKENTYDTYLRARLGTRLGRVIVPTTPHGYNWIYKRFYLPAVEGNPSYWAKIVSVLENKNFPKDEYEDAKKELPEDIFREQYEGEFVAYSGLIYKRFSRQNNVIPRFKIPPHWVRYMSIDPHPQTPAAVLWVAVDEHDTIYIYDEMFIPNLTISEVADRIKAKEYNDEIYKRLIDPNAKYIDKLRGQTASVQMQLVREGISCMPANNKFESAYYKIEELFTPKPVYGEKDKKAPRLYVFSDLKETIMELESCTWETEKDNHMLDNLKYIVNDNPVRTWTKEERKSVEIEERQFLQSMGKGGYGI